MKNDIKAKLDSIESKAVAKVEKLFNALKEDSVLKVKKKLIALNLLNLNQDALLGCNPQMDENNSGFHSKMEIIDESPTLNYESPTKMGSYRQPTSSFSIRKTKVEEETKCRIEEAKAASLMKSNSANPSQSENDMIKQAFIRCYKQEFHKRREYYIEQKSKKEEAFRELEQLKTSKRLVENKLNKTKKLKQGSLFPIRIEVCLSKAVIEDRQEITRRQNSIENLGVFYKVDNGKEFHDSVVVNNLDDPQWSDLFMLNIGSESEILFFQLVLDDKITNSHQLLDSFDLRGNEIMKGVSGSKIYDEIIHTSTGNQYYLSIKKKGDEFMKLKIIEKKIETKTQLHSKLNQLFGMAKESMENLYRKKGMDLVKEWGIMSKKAKETPKQSSHMTIEESKSKKGSTTPKPKYTSPVSMSFGSKVSSIKQKVAEKDLSKTLKPNPTKFQETLRKSKVVESGNLDDKKRLSLAKSSQAEKRSQITRGKSNDKLSQTQIFETVESKPLTQEDIRKDSLKKSRAGLGSSLVNFSLNDVARTNKVKSEYNMNLSRTISAGQLFSSFDTKFKVGGMLNENMMKDEKVEDNRSTSALSFNTTSLFSPLNKTVIGLSFARLTED